MRGGYMFDIKKPRQTGGALKKVTNRAGVAPQKNLCRIPILRKSQKRCADAFQFGQIVADHHANYGGSETNFLDELLNSVVCSTCRANFQAGYFSRKEMSGGLNGLP